MIIFRRKKFKSVCRLTAKTKLISCLKMGFLFGDLLRPTLLNKSKRLFISSTKCAVASASAGSWPLRMCCRMAAVGKSKSITYYERICRQHADLKYEGRGKPKTYEEAKCMMRYTCTYSLDRVICVI